MSSQNTGQFKAFVTQTDLDERRRKRQEEWEKVRKPDQPLEAPEEEYDPRSLYDRLQEQKDKKQAEYEEVHKLKNMIKGLDDDEVHFLDLVDKTREEIENRRLEEEGREIAEYRKAVANLAEEAEGQRLQELKNVSTQLASTSSIQQSVQRKSQSALLAGAVKRKSIEKNVTESSCKRSKPDSTTNNTDDEEVERKSSSDVGDSRSIPAECNTDTVSSEGALACIGVLPGLGVYTDSSDSEASSNSDEADLMGQYDLLGRSKLHNHTQQTSSPRGKS